LAQRENEVGCAEDEASFELDEGVFEGEGVFLGEGEGVGVAVTLEELLDAAVVG